ncbi:phage protein Gp13 family protein [Microbulbifer sp. 2201CG32-9]|uniref:phage protein Gp13 family protein n=1 Tax=Microbulbifer sp. 2201CG32-9 TaxID=3232309 RepID=UPI00345B5A72
MNRFTVVPASEVEARLLAPRLRECDVREISRTSGQAPLAALLESIQVSDTDMCWCALLEGIPVAMFGANGLTPQIGGIWLLASDDIRKHRRDFMRQCRASLVLMHSRYRYLTNFIDADNQVTLKWLEVLGFVPVNRFEKFGAGGTPFIQYASEA